VKRHCAGISYGDIIGRRAAFGAEAVAARETIVLLRKAEIRFRLATRDYAQLAAFRHALRGFLRFSEDAAAAVGLTTQHYQAMLVLRACPDERRVTVGDLARQLFIKHNSAVGLVDRLVEEKLVLREASSADRRKVELRLTGRGRQLLAKLAAMHRAELTRLGPVLSRFFAELPQMGQPVAAACRAGGAAQRIKPARARRKSTRPVRGRP
jgi:DNA-binding MarR family transcriptional regulator